MFGFFNLNDGWFSLVDFAFVYVCASDVRFKASLSFECLVAVDGSTDEVHFFVFIVCSFNIENIFNVIIN